MVKAVTPIPFVRARFFDRCGKPLAGGKVYTYDANTTTDKITYKDSYGLSPNTNPVILDAAGEADIYLDGTYRIRITDRNDVLVNDVSKIGAWFSGNLQDTLDNISGAMDDAIKPTLKNLEDTIATAAAAGAGANGWTDLFIKTEYNRNQRSKNNDTLTPHDFGAVGDGVADDTQALQKFFNNAQKGGFSRQNATYKVTATINIPTGFYFDGCGCTITSNIESTILQVIANADDYTLQNFKIKGKGKANGNQRGLLISAGTRFNVSNVVISDIAGIGILQEGGQLGVSHFGQKGHFVNVRAFNCWVGRKDSPNTWVAGQANNYVNEYCTWIGFEADECEIGNITSAGNNSFVGGKLTGNTDGLWLQGGANSTHGVMVGVQINHNRQYNVNIDSQTAGFEFSGCTIYGDNSTSGVVRVVNSRGIKFNGGQFEASVYCDGQYSNVLIANVYNNGNFEPVFGGTHPENIYKRGWMSANLTQNSGDFGGMSKHNDTANDYVYAVLSANFTAAAFNDVVVNFDTVKKSLRKRFNNGVYTCPWDGVYTVKGNLFVTGGGGFAKLVVNDLDYGGYFTLNKETQYGSYNCGFDADVICKQGDKIELHICTTTDASIAANQSSYLTVTAK